MKYTVFTNTLKGKLNEVSKTKSLLICTGLLLAFGLNAIAQPDNPEKRERIEAHRIAFLTTKLDLSPEEAQRFWPVYNQCQKEQEAIRKQNREELHGKKPGGRPNLDDMSDKEVEKMVDSHLASRQQELDVQKACLAKYKDVLPIKKVAKLFQAERQFKKELLREMRQRKEGQRRIQHPPR